MDTKTINTIYKKFFYLFPITSLFAPAMIGQAIPTFHANIQPVEFRTCLTIASISISLPVSIAIV